MSHELRTPLHTILGFTELLEEQTWGTLNPKQKGFLGHIRTDAEHLLNLINGILDLSKIEAGRLQLAYDVIDLRECISETVSGIQAQAALKSIAVEDRTTAGAPKILADPLRIRRVLYNLLANAIKFTPKGGRVWIEAFLENDSVKVTVADNGIGIESQDLEKIFDRFEQATSSVHVREGAGLGLAISKQLIELHGGSIWVESTPGKGSQFSFAIPVNPKAKRSQSE